MKEYLSRTYCGCVIKTKEGTQAGNAHSTTVQATESQGTVAIAHSVTVTTGVPPLRCSSTWVISPCPSLLLFSLLSSMYSVVTRLTLMKIRETHHLKLLTFKRDIPPRSWCYKTLLSTRDVPDIIQTICSTLCFLYPVLKYSSKSELFESLTKSPEQ